nr:MAG TPA: hypothetical protein [Caudoviricetes sp.]
MVVLGATLSGLFSCVIDHKIGQRRALGKTVPIGYNPVPMIFS